MLNPVGSNPAIKAKYPFYKVIFGKKYFTPLASIESPGSKIIV